MRVRQAGMKVTNRDHKGSDAVYYIGLDGCTSWQVDVRILDERCCKPVKRLLPVCPEGFRHLTEPEESTVCITGVLVEETGE